MCTTRWCLLDLPRWSRLSGRATVSRSPGERSFIKTWRWVVLLKVSHPAVLHVPAQVHPTGQIIRKGVIPDIDSYSAFFDNAKLSKTCLEEMVKKEGVSDVYVCGIATDVCVGKTRVRPMSEWGHVCTWCNRSAVQCLYINIINIKNNTAHKT